jgi:hypothetical protein
MSALVLAMILTPSVNVPLAQFLVALGLLDTIVQSEAGSHS